MNTAVTSGSTANSRFYVFQTTTCGNIESTSPPTRDPGDSSLSLASEMGDNALASYVSFLSSAYENTQYIRALDHKLTGAFTAAWAEQYRTHESTLHVKDVMMADLERLKDSETDARLISDIESVKSFLMNSNAIIIGVEQMATFVHNDLVFRVALVDTNPRQPLRPTRRSTLQDVKSGMTCAVAEAVRYFLEDAAFSIDDKLEFTLCSPETLVMYDNVTGGKPDPDIVRRITTQLNSIADRRRRADSAIESRMTKRRKLDRCTVCLEEKTLITCSHGEGKHDIACVECTRTLMVREGKCPQCRECIVMDETK